MLSSINCYILVKVCKCVNTDATFRHSNQSQENHTPCVAWNIRSLYKSRGVRSSFRAFSSVKRAMSLRWIYDFKSESTLLHYWLNDDNGDGFTNSGYRKKYDPLKKVFYFARERRQSSGNYVGILVYPWKWDKSQARQKPESTINTPFCVIVCKINNKNLPLSKKLLKEKQVKEYLSDV